MKCENVGYQVDFNQNDNMGCQMLPSSISVIPDFASLPAVS